MRVLLVIILILIFICLLVVLALSFGLIQGAAHADLSDVDATGTYGAEIFNDQVTARAETTPEP